MNETEEKITYRVHESYGRLPRMVIDKWELKTKIAYVVQGDGRWRERVPIERYNSAAKTPQEALDQWREREKKYMDDCAERLGRAKSDYEQARDARLDGDRLVLVLGEEKRNGNV